MVVENFFMNYIIVLITEIILLYLINDLANKKISVDFKLVIIVLLSSLFETLFSFNLSGAINGILCLTYFLLVGKFFFQLKLKDTIFYLIVIWLIGGLLDIVVMLIVNLLASKISLIQTNMFIIKPICSILMICFLVFIFKMKFVNKIVNKINNSLQKLNVSYFWLILILIIYFLLDAICIIYIKKQVVIVIILLISIGFSISIIYYIFNKYEIISLKETNNLLLKNNEFYLKVIDEYRILKHNLINQLLGVKSVSNKKARILIDDLIKEYNNNFRQVKSIKDIPSGLSGIIYEKIYNFNDHEINISVKNEIKDEVLELISARSYNLLCETLGVILDNSLEATSKSEEKIIYLEFMEKEDKLIINVINTFKNNIDLEFLGTINYSSKNKSRGLGLYSIIGRKNVSVKTTIRNNLFCHELTINKKKK